MTKINDLKSDHKNARKRTDRSSSLIQKSLEKFGAARSIVIDEENRILAGNGTIEGAKKAGLENVRIIETDGREIIAVKRTGLTEDEKVGLALADNRSSDLSEWDDEMLQMLSEEHDISDWFDNKDLNDLSEKPKREASGILKEKFGVPPFSVLNAREGWWQNRKKLWLELGIKSEVGRDEELTYSISKGDVGKRIMQAGGSTSVFDPVISELIYRWFSNPNAVILDPFAGGSVRGIVAATLGRKYIGVDLRKEQVEANIQQGEDILESTCEKPIWITGNSQKIDDLVVEKADLIFSCPPYVDLEVYSKDPNDLSNMDFDSFKENYAEIIKKSCDLLNENSFAAFVVGEVRKKDGTYYNFVGETIEAFIKAGLSFYNEAILVTMVGSLPLRCGNGFTKSRKLGKTHQNILVFVKGDPVLATDKCGACEFADPAAFKEENVEI